METGCPTGVEESCFELQDTKPISNDTRKKFFGDTRLHFTGRIPL